MPASGGLSPFAREPFGGQDSAQGVLTDAEGLGWLAAEGGGLELVTVNPGLVLGPVLGSDFSASIEAVKKLLDGSIPALPRFGFNVVDVRDIARLHVLAMTTPEANRNRLQ